MDFLWNKIINANNNKTVLAKQIFCEIIINTRNIIDKLKRIFYQQIIQYLSFNKFIYLF